MTDGDENDAPPYLERKSDALADSETLFTNQSRFIRHPHSLSRNIQRYNNYTNYNNNNYRIYSETYPRRQYGPGPTRLTVRTLHHGSFALTICAFTGVQAAVRYTKIKTGSKRI